MRHEELPCTLTPRPSTPSPSLLTLGMWSDSHPETRNKQRSHVIGALLTPLSGCFRSCRGMGRVKGIGGLEAAGSSRTVYLPSVVSLGLAWTRLLKTESDAIMTQHT